MERSGVSESKVLGGRSTPEIPARIGQNGPVSEVPIIDVRALREPDADPSAVGSCGERLDAACREVGFFVITGHGIDAAKRARLDEAARAFFALDDADKARIAMPRAGRAWRGWFAEGDELTSGRADHKEGIYFGTDVPADDPRVVAGLPLHGANLYPEEPADLRGAVIAWMDEVTALAQDLLRGIAVGLDLEPDWFADNLTADPTVLFRIFRYPVAPRLSHGPTGWGVGEHTDYGLVTLLAHDGTPGLQVRPRGTDEWLDVPADPETFVVNLGDMLEAMTHGRYRSTPHRVRVPKSDEAPADGRLSFPLFLDPGFDSEIVPIPTRSEVATDDAPLRWDGADLTAVRGTYGQYLVRKVAKVFPDLGAPIT